MTATAACGSCASCDTEEEPDEDVGVAEVEPEEEDTRADELAEAKEEAEALADELAFDLTQHARLIASEIEGAQTDGPDIDAPRPRDDGKIDVDAVQKIFNEKHGNLQKCYERALKRDQTLQGTVKLSVRVGTDGSPALVQANSQEIHDSSALECMENEARRWSFPRPTGGTVMLNKPFRFTPNQ